RSKNKKATLITTPIENLSGVDILQAMEQSETIDALKCELEHEHHHHHHDEHCDCGCHDHHSEGEHHHEHHHHDEHCNCGCHDHHHADEVFTSWGKETSLTFTTQQIKAILTAMDEGEYGSVLRAKGYVKGEDGWIYFDYVPSQADIRSGSAAVIGRVCVIGADINEAALNNLFSLED
ncbi:MAG: GTP-binding protein, partial [Clostridia bacterium]|nr:GTP-binding protein [Clostridia bacterium]